MGWPMRIPLVVGFPTTSRSGRRSPLLPHRSGWGFSKAPGVNLGSGGPDLASTQPGSLSLFGYLRPLLAGFATGAGIAVVFWHLF